jgi:hypothetical protein
VTDPDIKPVVFTRHAQERMHERGATEAEVEEAIRIGQAEPAQRGLTLYRLNVEFQGEWDGRWFGVKQVAPIVAEEYDRIVVVTVYTFFFQEGGQR